MSENYKAVYEETKLQLAVLNGYIITTPLVVQNIESSVKSGFVTLKNKNTFQFVEVLYGDGKTCWPKQQVMLRADAFVLPWAKNKYIIEGRECILVPLSEVIAVKL